MARHWPRPVSALQRSAIAFPLSGGGYIDEYSDFRFPAKLPQLLLRSPRVIALDGIGTLQRGVSRLSMDVQSGRGPLTGEVCTHRYDRFLASLA